jgi:4-alpha-glucanotransferase
MERGQASPYAATSTLAIDPIYVALPAVPDFERAGGIEALSPAARDALETARRSRHVRHDAVRRAKDEALALAFGNFVAHEWAMLTPRAAALAGYVARERWWLDEFALFQAIAAAHGGASWRDWPAPLRDRDARALDDVRRQLARDVLFHQYLQWIAQEQWQEARQIAARHGVTVYGDLPFVANDNSHEVWTRTDEFLPGVSAGVPPDAFSPTGQDWGLPTYSWAAIAASGYAAFQLRARRMAALCTGVRVDHVVGLFRTYGRPRTGEPFFTPEDEASQRAQGEAVLTVLRDSGMALIAEDLGLVPDFVRASLEALGVPGCKVLRWEREWETDGAPFRSPDDYPSCSAAMTGTHDTVSMAVWWEDECTPADREALFALPLFQGRGLEGSQGWTTALRDLLLELLYRSKSRDLFPPFADLFGWPDRINTPGTVNDENWTWTLPWAVDRLRETPDARERASFLRRLAAVSARLDRSGADSGLD